MTNSTFIFTTKIQREAVPAQAGITSRFVFPYHSNPHIPPVRTTRWNEPLSAVTDRLYMKKDYRKGLNFGYNFLNLVSDVWHNDTVKVRYQYLADRPVGQYPGAH